MSLTSSSTSKINKCCAILIQGLFRCCVLARGISPPLSKPNTANNLSAVEKWEKIHLQIIRTLYISKPKGCLSDNTWCKCYIPELYMEVHNNHLLQASLWQPCHL